MKDYLIENVHDKYTIKAFQYVLDSLLDSPDETGQIARIKLHSFIQDYSRIGGDSANGVALQASIGGYSNHRKAKLGSVVVKVPRSSLKNPEIIHEAAIGHYLNEERDNCVIFSAVYDGYIGGAPVLSESGIVSEYFNDGEIKLNHAIYEHVNDAKAITETHDRDELLLSIVHSILGLNYMSEKLDFTHYDCHDSNTRIFNYSEEIFYIPHEFKGRKIYVKAYGSFPMFIDYGMSHIQFKDGDKIVNHGVMDPIGKSSRHGIYNDMANPVSDCFKLIMFIIRKYDKHISDESRNYDRNVKKLKKLEECKKLALRLAGYFFSLENVTMNDGLMVEEFENCRDEDFGISMKNFNEIHNNMWSSRYYLRPEVINFYNFSVSAFAEYCIDVANVTISDCILLEQPENVLGKTRIRRPQNQEEQINQIQRQLTNMGIESVIIANAKDLFISQRDETKDRIENLFLLNVNSSHKNDMQRIEQLLNYEWTEYLFIFPPDKIPSESEISILNQSISSIAEFVQKMTDINDEIDIFQYAIRILSSNNNSTEEEKSLYITTCEALKHKILSLNKKKESNKKALYRSCTNINRCIFHKADPSNEEVDQYILSNKDDDVAKYYSNLINVYNSICKLK